MRKGVNRAVAVYARTATDGVAGLGCERQVRAARKVAGEDPVVFADVARSGNDAKRPGLGRLLEVARAGQISRVLVRDATRLARNPDLLADVLQQLAAAGAVVETIEEAPANA